MYTVRDRKRFIYVPTFYRQLIFFFFNYKSNFDSEYHESGGNFDCGFPNNHVAENGKQWSMDRFEECSIESFELRRNYRNYCRCYEHTGIDLIFQLMVSAALITQRTKKDSNEKHIFRFIKFIYRFVSSTLLCAFLEIGNMGKILAHMAKMVEQRVTVLDRRIKTRFSNRRFRNNFRNITW